MAVLPSPTIAPKNISEYLAQKQDAYTQANLKYTDAQQASRGYGLWGTPSSVLSELHNASDARKEAQQDLSYTRGQLESDPWGFYRAGFADQLASTQGTDPSNIYRDKLQAMSTGQFGIDDPSYKWRFEQGQQALERSQAARGLLGSGNAAIELQEYGQGAASQEYGAQFTRMLQAMSGVQQQYSSQQARLMELAGVGLDPLGSRKVGVGEMGNAISAQGNQLQAQSQANRLGFEQTQWQDQLNMNAEYQSGLKAGLSGGR